MTTADDEGPDLTTLPPGVYRCITNLIRARQATLDEIARLQCELRQREHDHTSALLAGLMMVLLWAGAAEADLRVIPLAAEESQISLIDQSRDALHFRVEVAELTALDVMTREGLFTRLQIPGFHSSKAVGAPELPTMNRLFEIPYGARTRVEILSTESRTIDLSEHGIENLLLPAQPSMPKSADPDTWPFVYDAAAYGFARVAQDLVTVVEQGRLRAVQIGRLDVSPVEYFPAANRITVTESIEFRLLFEGADHTRGEALKAATRSPFFEPVYDQIAGYQELRTDYPDRVRDVVTMVIVTAPEFETMLADFVDWKIERGFHTILAVRGTPEVGNTANEIKAYIHDLYNNGTPELPAPSFALFVGDVTEMPTFLESGDVTDRPYCACDGDVVPDIYYGRFSARTPAELQPILDKTLMYDQFTMPDPSYLGEVVMIAGMDSHGQVWANGHINYGTDNYFNAAHGILSHTYLYPESGDHAAHIVQNVSDGVAFVNYIGHGSETSWLDPHFGQTDINGLQNYGEYCLAVGNCCMTSSYGTAECFAETWLRTDGKGAIGYVGASSSSYWDEDWWWGVGSGIIVEHPTYANTGKGAYDGLFHDHGEPMEEWYVTNDAIIFCGNLAVMEAGSSRTTYYWNIYNLMGDPSLSTYLGVPTPNPVAYPPVLFTNATTMTVDAVPGSYVGLTQDGEIMAAGTIGEAGSLELTVSGHLIPGTARLLVMAQNRVPYSADLNVIAPAVVTLDPHYIETNTATDVTVGVYEADGQTPRPGCLVWAEGLDYTTPAAMTGPDGRCVINIDYPYGPSIDIVGRDPGDPWNLFRVDLEVVALSLNEPSLTVTTTIGLNNVFPLNLEGTLVASVMEPGHTLWAFVNDEPGISTTGYTLPITPTETGSVRGVIAVSGYDLYEQTFPIIEVYGTLSGYVGGAGAPAEGAMVRGYDSNRELVFEAETNAQGNYSIPDEILVAPYTVTVDLFGFLHWEEPFFINYGANVLDVELEAAPSGVLAGNITEAGTGLPLEATVKVYRSDNMALYTETMSSPSTGAYTTDALPHFDYVVRVKASHHISVNVTVTIEEPMVIKNFVLDPTVGDLLLIDATATAGQRPAKRGGKEGLVIGEAYQAPELKTVLDITTDLRDIGYEVTVETMAGTDPGSWENYDMLVVCSGNNTRALSNSTFRNALEQFALGGGRLLIEGGEVGHDLYGTGSFAQNVLHITDWTANQGGNVTIVEPAHYVASVPNLITGPITMAYRGYGDQDALVPTPDAVRVGSWTFCSADASIIAYDPNSAPEGGQIVFLTFNYSAMDVAVRPLLLENAVQWLLTPEVGNCTVSGTVTLEGQSNHSNVRVEAVPNGGFVMTGPTGEYTLPGLFAGTYQIIASKNMWSTGIEEVTLSAGQHLTDVDFLLTPVMVSTHCSAPGLPIPDANPAGVSDAIDIALAGQVIEVEVFVNITHTYIGNLLVTLTSPAETTVVLHNRSGGSANNIYGWYPSQLQPAESLDALIGEPTDGVWTLHVSDHVGGDVGVFHEWCMRIYFGGTTAVGEPDASVPEVLALSENVPNPFNPSTRITFDLSRSTDADLAVYDITGRRVATLLSGPMDAGRYQVAWRGRSDDGRPLASGLYLYRLQAQGQTMTRRMLLLK